MCFDPATIAATVAANAGTISTVSTVLGGIITAQAQGANARAAERTARINAMAHERVAKQRVQQGEEESDRARRAGAVAQAQQRAALAANGVDIGSGNAIEILDGTQLLAEEDAFSIRETARRAAGNDDVAAANERIRAQTARSEGRYAPVRTILGTASKVGSRYSYMLTPGPKY